MKQNFLSETIHKVSIALLTILLLYPPTLRSNEHKPKKELFLPEKIWQVPENNDFNNPESKYSYSRMAESENLALFWSAIYGENPAINPDKTKAFDPDEVLRECERFYNYYVDVLKFVEKGNSITDKYKAVMFVMDGEDGTAYGGGSDQKIGILWSPPARMNTHPYGALAHELGHSFQYLVSCDGNWGFTSAPEGSRGQTMFEMTSQYMLWQVYHEWMTFENYHLNSFMQKTHYAFLHETNQYHSPYVLEYWSNKHGLDFVGTLWREVKQGEDAVMAYKRLTSIGQEEFNDEIFDAARRFITWDMERIRDVAAPYANQHKCTLDPVGGGWYRIAETSCPQNYGYNGIQLNVPQAGKTVTVDFKGLAGQDGFRAIHLDKAGWRYGFLAMQKDGTRVYGKMYSDANGKGSFKVPKDTEYLWLVVSGAPTEHWEHISDWKDENDEQWAYQIKLTGTTLANPSGE